MTIGEKIKQLRKEKDITQEKLAEYLHISYQAISKWENNTASPDLSLIVPLANFFGVTTDTLFCRDEEEQKKEIEALQKEGLRLANLGLVKEQILLWRFAVSKYPNSFECLECLAYSLLGALHAQAFDETENNRCIGEAIQICDRILEDCTDHSRRASATQILVMIYGNKHCEFYNQEKAVKYALNSTSIFNCREILLVPAHGYTSEKAQAQKHANNVQFVDFLHQNIAVCSYPTADQELTALHAMLSIWNAVFYDNNFLFYHCRIAEIYRRFAILYAKIGKYDEAMESLKLAKEHAAAYMNIPDGEQHYTSILVCKAIHDNAKTSKNFTGSELDLVRDILKTKIFDAMRHSKDFMELEGSLSEYEVQ